MPAAQHPPLHRGVQPPRAAREDYRQHSQKTLDLHPPGEEEGQAHPSAWTRDARRERGLNFERAGVSATRSPHCNGSNRGDANTDVQPEVFPIDPKKGLHKLKKKCEPRRRLRARSRAWTSHPERPGHGRVAGVVPRRAAVQAGVPPLQDQRAWEGWTTSRACARS